MIQNKHENYKIADFLDDESFLNAIKHNKVEDVDYWKAWVKMNPSNLASFEAAETQLRLLLSSVRIKPNPEFLDSLWTEINQTVYNSQRAKARVIRLRIVAAAAVFAGLAISFSLWFFNSTIEVSVPYGNRKEILLPDGSEILLNANSVLSYARAYQWKTSREVFLKGEGYFKVTHGHKFIVHTKHLDVQVLGTEFNIKERRGTTQVALIRGSVAVTGNSSNRIARTMMQPADLFSYKDETKKSVKIKANPEVYKAWTENKSIAENSTIGSVINDFEDIYGQKIVLENPALNNRIIDGVIPMGNKENTLFVIANILNVRIENHGDTILLKTRK